MFEQASNGLFEWFKNNLLKSNADKFDLLVSTNDRVSINVDEFKIDKSYTEKLLGTLTSLTSVKRQVEKCLLWPELHHTW